MHSRVNHAVLRFVLISLCFFTPALVFGSEHYDEVFDQDGAIRLQYAGIYQIWANMSQRDKERFKKLTLEDFIGDNPLSPLPRIVLESDYEEIKRGVEQRAKVLQAFLLDHYSGRKSYLSQGIIPQYVMERILRRSNTESFDGELDPAKVRFRFAYGPDIIRDKHGQWRVYEDNTTFVGGFGDLILARQIMQKRFPQMMAQLDPVDNPEDFYKTLADRFKSLARLHGGKPVMLTLASTQLADRESLRLRRIFKDLGIDFVSTGTDRRLVVEPDAVYLVHPGGRREKVGFIYMVAEHNDIDFSRRDVYEAALTSFTQDHLQNYEFWRKPYEPHGDWDKRWWNYGQRFPLAERNRVERALRQALNSGGGGRANFEELERLMREDVHWDHQVAHYVKGSVNGLTDAILDGRVGSSNTPGINMFDDKEFYIYVEALTRHYLNEAPILRNVESGSFAVWRASGQVQTDQTKIRSVFSSPNDYVIKGVSGRGGDSVYILRKKNAQEIRRIKEQVLENPGDFIWQRYSPPSRHGDDIGDYRPLSQVFENDIVVSPTMWLRGSSVGGSGLVNISSKTGHEVAAVVVKDSVADPCVSLSARNLLQEKAKN